MFRLVKALKLLFNMDLAWTESRRFEAFTTTVIMINSITMGMELDIPWDGWSWVNTVFLMIYTFEVLVKIKRYKRLYFYHPTNFYWHWLDFIIVCSGLIEMFGLPA